MECHIKHIAVYTAVLLTAVFPVSCKQATFDEQCAKEAEIYTEKQCPIKVSEGVVLDSMTYSKSTRSLSYHYTVSGKLDDATLIQNNINTIRNGLMKGISNSVELKQAKEEGIYFRYLYTSASTHKQFAKITISKSDYNK